MVTVRHTPAALIAVRNTQLDSLDRLPRLWLNSPDKDEPEPGPQR